ncbi:sugar ABC transporter permease [Reticulibacter mediterranei]|uniref:Sugar ABC transporter permease n=1 Tax=Reticulibacter mediterranei TaxID=2778369 RepID=A0A8J3IB47_9CHLR|nr:carbohydrate ABC transporter permease [Reticulibacter mediterranei]GHO90378.1 sugar ABC transporter permease [Reticulibacter mediterranei]
MSTKLQVSESTTTPLSDLSGGNRPRRTHEIMLSIPVYLLLIIIAVVMVAPFVAMISVSLQAGNNAAIFPIQWIPSAPTLSNYINIFQTSDIARWFLNSLIVAVVGTLLAIFTSTTAAYAFARMNFPLRRVIFWSFLAMLMIPSQVTLIPEYLLLANLHWLNSYQSLILPGITSAFGTFMIRQYLLGLPRDFEEAARIDGASEFQVYARIVLPMLTPAIATLATIQFLNYWNEFLYVLVVTSDSEMRTLPAGLATLQTPTSGLPELLAGTTIAIVPTVIVFLLLQRYFVRGIVMSGLKS